MRSLKRPFDEQAIKKLLAIFPVVAILGPRQCGKTVMAHMFSADHYFDLENPQDLNLLGNALLALDELEGLIVIDEIQRQPELFSTLRYLVDKNKKQQYLILGSASQELIKQSSESLSGRIGYHYLSGFSLQDTGPEKWKMLWHRGSFPRSFLSKNDEASFIWRDNYIATYLERDLPQLGIRVPAYTLRRFWMMLSHYHGQIVNYAELARSFGISDMTARAYVGILEKTFMLRLLYPWHTNTAKRLVKSPKLYIRDSGIFHNLQSIETSRDLEKHIKLGASWEGYALEQIAGALGKKSEELFFWATHAGAELDLFWKQKGKNWGIEIKYGDAPRLTKSMRAAFTDLELAYLWVVYPGKKRYKLDHNIEAVPLFDFVSRNKRIPT